MGNAAPRDRIVQVPTGTNGPLDAATKLCFKSMAGGSDMAGMEKSLVNKERSRGRGKGVFGWVRGNAREERILVARECPLFKEERDVFKSKQEKKRSM